MELLVRLITGFVEGTVWGALLLVVAVVILPEKIFYKLLNRLKPDIISKKTILPRLRIVFDYVFNNKDVIIDDNSSKDSKALQHEIAYLMREKQILEGNLFFLDLLKGLTGMLTFSVRNSGYSDSAVCEILNQSMRYLLHYAQQLQDSDTSMNLAERVSLAASRLEGQTNDTTQFLRKEEGQQELEIARHFLKMNTQAFDSFMKKEYQSARENLRRINQLMADKFMVFIGERSEQDKS